MASETEDPSRPEYSPERPGMLFSGTIVTRGSGEGVVVATAMDSELGGIARLVEGAAEERTPLERRLAQLGKPRKLISETAAPSSWNTPKSSSQPLEATRRMQSKTRCQKIPWQGGWGMYARAH